MGDESDAAPGRGRQADRGEHPQLLLPVSGRLVRVVCFRKPTVAKATNACQVLQLTHSGKIRALRSKLKKVTSMSRSTEML